MTITATPDVERGTAELRVTPHWTSPAGTIDAGTYAREWMSTDDPAHAGIRAAWTDERPDPRVTHRANERPR